MAEGLEDMIRRIVEEVLEREKSVDRELPRAFLIGEKPNSPTGYTYIREGEYEAVVIGSMTAWELLQFPNEVCTEALVRGKPVLLWEQGLLYRKYKEQCNRTLYTRLLSAERQLKQYGVQPIRREDKKFLTAREVRHRLDAGLPLEGRLTPLARDLLDAEGK